MIENGSVTDTKGLAEWEEAVGVLRSVRTVDTTAILDFGGFNVRIPLKAKPDELDELTGKRIGLLRTAMAEKPYVVRAIE